MVQLAGVQHVRLTLLFSAQYADYISSSPARVTALEGWKKGGHEVGAYHQGPDTKAWDGYSDLSRGALARVRSGKAPGSVPGHAEYFSALGRLASKIKTGCMGGQADKDFLAAAPEYEVCAGAEKTGLTPRGVNWVILSYTGSGGAKKRLSTSCPSDKAGIEAAKKAFFAMGGGVYGAAFKSSPSEFGAFYAWLQFLKDQDLQCLRSRTVTEAVEEILIAKKAVKSEAKALTDIKPAAVVPAEAEKTKFPRLKPKSSPYSQVDIIFGRRFRRGLRTMPRAYCGDGLCDAMEKRLPGRCPRDCGAEK